MASLGPERCPQLWPYKWGPDHRPDPPARALHVALFYKYVRVPDLPSAAEHQRQLCSELKLTGRIRMATEGINGLLAGTSLALDQYRDAMNRHPVFSDIQYKLSRAAECPFGGELVVRQVAEITATGAMENTLPTALGGTGGVHLAPTEFHQAVLRCQSDSHGRKQVLIITNHAVCIPCTFLIG